MWARNSNLPFTYDHRNLAQRIIAGAGTHEYAYDYTGRRIGKRFWDDSSETWTTNVRYIYGAYGELVSQYDGITLSYWNILAGGETIGRAHTDDNRFYYLKDHLGSVQVTVTRYQYKYNHHHLLPSLRFTKRSHTPLGSGILHISLFLKCKPIS
jgi:YD repeat-containing protein